MELLALILIGLIACAYFVAMYVSIKYNGVMNFVRLHKKKVAGVGIVVVP